MKSTINNYCLNGIQSSQKQLAHFLSLLTLFTWLWNVELIPSCFGENFPCFNQQPALVASQQTFQFDGRFHQLFNAIRPEPFPIIAIGFNYELFNQWQHGGFNLKSFSEDLRTQSPTVAAPTGDQSSENPTGNHPQGIVWNLKCAGWYLGNHLWLYPASLAWLIYDRIFNFKNPAITPCLLFQITLPTHRKHQ
jgi:hypothetical protein